MCFKRLLLLILAFSISAQGFSNPEEHERDCCRRKKVRREDYYEAHHKILQGVAPSGPVATAIAAELGLAGVVLIPIAMIGAGGTYLVAKAAKILGDRENRLYKKCLRKHFEEYLDDRRNRLNAEKERAFEAEKRMWGKMGGLENAQNFLSVRHLELENAGYTRYLELERYRKAQNRNARLKKEISSLDKTIEKIHQNIQGFDFFQDRSLGDSFSSTALENGDIYMELHGPDWYGGSELRWLQVYYDHSKRFSYDGASYKESEEIESANRERHRLDEESTRILDNIAEVNNQIASANERKVHFDQKYHQFEQERLEADKTREHIETLKDKIDADKQHFIQSRSIIDSVNNELEGTIQQKNSDLNDLRQQHDSLSSLRQKIWDAEDRATNFENYPERLRIVDFSKYVAQELTNQKVDKNLNQHSVTYESMVTLLDLALSVAPVVSTGRDFYEAISGKHILTGEDLDSFDRVVACAGMLTFGVGSKFAKLGQGVLSKFFKTDEAVEILQTGEKLYDIRKPELASPPELGGFPEGIGYDRDLKSHMKDVQDFVRKSNKGVVGGHNKKEFLKVADELDLKIVEITDHGHGIEKIKYQMTALDKSGNVIGYREKKLTKTVYNSDIISDEKILEYGQKAAALKFSEQLNEQRRIYSSEYMGIKFAVYLNLEKKYIVNIHPE